MGREIRRVPPNWQHPKRDPDKDPYRHGGYQPMYDEHFDAKFAEWLADFDRIRAGNLTDNERRWYPRGLADWLCDEGTPPDPAYYRPYRDDERAWFQLYETVSEGTPVSPPFATKEELAQHLAEHGDDWDASRGKGGWGIERARAFVDAGWSPTMMVVGNTVLEAQDIPLHLATKTT